MGLFTSEEHKNIVKKLLKNWFIFQIIHASIRCGSKFFKQNVGIQMRCNCAAAPSPFAGLFLFYYDVSCKGKTDDMIGAFNSTSRYLDDLLNIENN